MSHGLTVRLVERKRTMSTNETTTKRPTIDAVIDGGKLTLDFSNGEVIEMLADQLSPEIQRHAMMHGLKQKLVDAAAIARNTETGRSASVEDKFAAVKEVADRLRAGEWNKRREGGGAGTGGLLMAALCALYPNRTEEQLATWLAGKSKAEQAALRVSGPVAEVIERIKAERGMKAEGEWKASALLAELDEARW